MKYSVLCTWIGRTDLDAAEGKESAGLGPIGQAVHQRSFTHVWLLCDYPKDQGQSYAFWLKKSTAAIIKVFPWTLKSPTNYSEIYEAAISLVEHIKKELGEESVLFTYHLSPGTPAMAADWIILEKTHHHATLIESYKDRGVQTVSIPFEISAEYVPDIKKLETDTLAHIIEGLPPDTPEFEAIIHKSLQMKRVIAQAKRLADYSVPVLILGEAGTGKELFARAIHYTGKRKDKPFVAINCGAIPTELVESELFGYKKGAFTGAHIDKSGHFFEADGGTLFLDEIGELPLAAQVKLLRALQEGEVTRIGDSKAKKVDVRLIAATNKDIRTEITAGRFREDLFHRIAVGLLTLPSLRERKGDLNLLIDYMVSKVNRELNEVAGWKEKSITPAAKNVLLQHNWPGNVRELQNTIYRAAIWCPADVITEEDIKSALFPVGSTHQDDVKVLNRSLGGDFKLSEIIAYVARHYLTRAEKEGKGKKAAMAKLLGFANYQTLSNWMKKYMIILYCFHLISS